MRMVYIYSFYQVFVKIFFMIVIFLSQKKMRNEEYEQL